MAFKIGFAADTGEKKPVAATYTVPQQAAAPRKSVMQIQCLQAKSNPMCYWD